MLTGGDEADNWLNDLTPDVLSLLKCVQSPEKLVSLSTDITPDGDDGDDGDGYDGSNGDDYNHDCFSRYS